MDARLTLAIAVLCVSLAPAQSAPRLLADLDQRPAGRSVMSSRPSEFARLGAWTYFAAEDLDHGREVFRTNGAAAGTSLFVDLVPGSGSSTPRQLTAAGTRLFFIADDGVAGPQPFVSDGNPGGTRRIPGFGSLGTMYQSVGVLDSRWILLGDRPGAQTLWVTDGTAEGTSAIVEPSDLEEGELLSAYPRAQQTVIAVSASAPVCLFRSAISALVPGYLWRSDGTRAGTLRVPLPVGGSLALLGVVNDRALVLANEWILPTTRRDYLFA